MARTAFNARLGASQGRLEASAVGSTPAPSGDFVFVLGDAEAGRLHELASGDHVEARQVVDLTDADLVRAQLRLRVPASAPSGWRWVASIRVDGSPLAQATCAAGRERVLTDLAANVSKLAGPHEVAVRLTLEEV
jgi:hypothetical protein